MSCHYLVTIDEPHKHMIKVSLTYAVAAKSNKVSCFLPSWSPGSYLMREYSRQVQSFRVTDAAGDTVSYEKIAKGTWEFHGDFQKNTQINVQYEVYARELTVRTSYVDGSHAFLHGPSYLVGIEGELQAPMTIEFRFPEAWTKLSTSLKDITTDRKVFLYQADNYDQLLDTPVEIGNQITDGFSVNGIDHHLCFFGKTFPQPELAELKKDMKTIVEHVSGTMGDIPYEQYLFIIHLLPNLYGGLEHQNSTAIQFDGRKLNKRKDYIQWLALVAHEYFHTWNVKRIRPRELGPFKYTEENYTSMLWLVEGLTSFMDELFVLRCGLCSLEEYLDMQLGNLKRYYTVPGRKFHSLEESSFDAWIKRYRPDEHFANSSVCYYLKGGIVFQLLHVLLYRYEKSINHLIAELWQLYKKRPDQGVVKDEVFNMVEKLSDAQTREIFETMVTTREDIDIESYYREMGIEFVYEEKPRYELGVTLETKGERLFVKSVRLDGGAHKSGLNASDEIIALNNQRVTDQDLSSLEDYIQQETDFPFTISRMGLIETIWVRPRFAAKKLKELKITDREKALALLTY